MSVKRLLKSGKRRTDISVSVLACRMGFNQGVSFEVVLGAFVEADVDDFFDISVVPVISVKVLAEVMVVLRIGLMFWVTNA